ncbi:SAM-dependent methyltransferase [Pseudonocardia sp. MH-G8]|uniref:SAM-dependent methyltransferase n=1 Tax=Pseudonocardia sp. MH-G8 TaxID=1854588 RepID=UPI000B9FD059|nr:SAM-dependent methyltransferase [Pseudonocardia sp. MH-G8]OZM83060.1 S-adenosyl methyltransferase [Pseudonocardia sp. MH-G8]
MSDDAPGDPALLPAELTRVPSSARVWNYWLGGKDYYAVDRDAGDTVAASYPQIVTLARQSRQFLIRAVRTLAGELGVRQFLDIGTGLPTMLNTHEVAQAIAPDCRVVYVDNDPIVLAHARVLLANTTAEGRTSYVDADVHDPERILAEAREILDFDRPIAVMFLGMLGYVADFDEAKSIATRVMDEVAPGSYLLVRDNTDSGDGVREAADNYAKSGVDPYHLRTVAQLGEYFAGLDLVEPGVVPVEQWRPGAVELGATHAEHTGDHGGLGRKP